MSRLDALVLLRGVREIASHADAENPVQVSQRRFDAARTISVRYNGLPYARDIARQLRMPWREVVALAHAPSSTHAHRLGRAHSLPAQDWLTEAQIAYVLKVMAGRLQVPTLNPRQYRAERARMLALDRSRWLHGRRLRLPTDEQIRLVAGVWDRALALAELDPRAGLGDQGHGSYASSTVELLERCYAAHGAEPSALDLRRFARANGIPWTPDRDRTWLECVAVWKDQRRAQGLAVPDGPPPRSERPDYNRDVGVARPGERRKQDWSRIENCLPHVIAYLEQLGAGERSSKLGYSAWAASQDTAPSYSAFDQHGGWGRLRALAVECSTALANSCQHR